MAAIVQYAKFVCVCVCKRVRACFGRVCEVKCFPVGNQDLLRGWLVASGILIITLRKL